MRQDLQKAQPSVDNALSLGMLAAEAAANETNQASGEALYAVADSAFEQARQIDPSDRRMLYRYAEYLRAQGRGEEAKKLLQESQDEQLLWDHYYQAGQYADARRVLERLYKSGTKDGTVLRGLMFVAEKLFEKEAVYKYSEELTKTEDSAENNLAQIRTFLRVGLIKEAEHKLQSFKEKYPNEPRILLLQAWLVMRQGQLDKALELANRNLQSNPDNPTAWRLKGEINFFRGDYDMTTQSMTSRRASCCPMSLRLDSLLPKLTCK
ncbi:MAG: tetratricopeptide repeat protein [Planctomycetota bacterium]|jgi:tetratricopeptide (TPR) repeat protein